MDDELWNLLVADDEQLLWTGRPSDGWHFRRNDWLAVIIYLMGFAVSAMACYAGIRNEGPIWFLIVFGAFGLFSIVALPLLLMRQRYLRSRTRYAITDERILVVVSGSPSSLREYLVSETNRLDIANYRDGLSCVFFRDEYLAIGGKVIERNSPAEIGLEFIRDGDQVLDTLEKLGAGNGPNYPPMTKTYAIADNAS